MGPRILLIDSYDSFTYNLAALCKAAIPKCHVHIIKNNVITKEELSAILPSLSAVVVGPGPGSPDYPADVGIINELWRLSDSNCLPIFGVCLGLQSLALAFGGHLRRLNVVKHGQVSQLQHDGTGLFKGVSAARVVRYHSLHVELDEGGAIEELASADDGVENGHVVMALRHVSKPFWAVQYHPESACTDGGGSDVLRNFWNLADAWSALNERQQAPWVPEIEKIIGPSWPCTTIPREPCPSEATHSVEFATLYLPHLSISQASEKMGALNESLPFVLLQSAAHPGRFSILGCVDNNSPRILFFAGETHVSIVQGEDSTHVIPPGGIWSWLASYMRSRRVQGGHPEVPFWGGLIGYLSYELGTAGLSSSLPSQIGRRGHPDVNLIFVERTIVFDQLTKIAYIQTIRPGDAEWIAQARTLVTDACCAEDSHLVPSALFSSPPIIHLPDETLYKARIQAAKERLFAGDSYELCLTAQTRIFAHPISRTPPSSSSWHLYKLLQNKNPAPHSGYLRLHPSTLISSSPERFLSFSRPPHSRCQLRPIKGTVKKTPGINREVAERLLAGSKKEVAENLMIVDLIRHDLYGVVGEDVKVKQFCQVEEYETVWQLTSVIEGSFSPAVQPQAEDEPSWKVLQHSLPPGSMTGAPKKRSVEILHGLEDHDRSLYSGVFGYWDVGGGGDWSVVIRSCFKYDDGSGDRATAAAAVNTPWEEWTIGAGGAITALSDPQEEWEEMCIKLKSVLQTFSYDSQ